MTTPIAGNPVLRRPAKQPHKELLVAAAIVAVLALVENAKPIGSSMEETAGAVAGSALALAGVAWAILYFAYLRNSGRRVGGQYFAVLFAVATTFGAVSAMLLAAPRAQATKDALYGAGHSYQSALDADSANYTGEMEALRIDELLTPEKLVSDNDRAAAKLKIQQAHLIIAKYRTLLTSEQDHLREKIRQIDPQLVPNFDAGLAKVQPLLSKRWDVENARLVEVDSLVDLLSRAKGAWTVVAGKLLFRHPEDLKAFNIHVESLRQLSAESQQITQQINDEGQNSRQNAAAQQAP